MLGLFLAVFSEGCAIRRLAINKLGDALASGGTVFAADDDLELVKSAAPFSLKLMESLLAESPRHRGLLGATASGFTQYAFAFVQQEAEEVQDHDVAASLEMRQRARRLYLRARDYGLRGMEAAHPGFAARFHEEPKSAVDQLKREDVALVYWTAAAWGSAIGIIKNDTDLIAELPFMEALIDRALELDEAYDAGAIHSFLITYEMTRSGTTGDPVARAKQHFDRAMALCRGQQAGPLVALAEAVCVAQQNRAEFQSLLHQALALDPNAKPEWRLVNLVMQRRARWLLRHTDDLIAHEASRPRTASEYSCAERGGASLAPAESGGSFVPRMAPPFPKPARASAPNPKV